MFEGEGVIVQYAYIVDDLDTAIDHWISNIGAGPFFVKRHWNDLELVYRGKKSTLDMSVALGQAGANQIELIQVHCDNPTVYTDLHPKGNGGGFHHVAMFAKNFEAAVKAYEDKGFECGMRGILEQLRLSIWTLGRRWVFSRNYIHRPSKLLGCIK